EEIVISAPAAEGQRPDDDPLMRRPSLAPFVSLCVIMLPLPLPHARRRARSPADVLRPKTKTAAHPPPVSSRGRRVPPLTCSPFHKQILLQALPCAPSYNAGRRLKP